MSSSAGPWSVKGIDPRAREIAKDLARRSGLTLGEWLNHKIADEDVVAPPYAARRPEPQRYDYARAEAFRPETFRPETFRPETFRPEPRPEPQDSHRASAELARVAEALGELSDRVESAERRSTLAISGIDQSVLGVVSRLEAVERDQGAVAARFDGALEEIRTEQARAAERDRRGEQAESVRMEATKALEAALGKVASQLYESEGHTRAAISEIREDLTGVARRMDRVDARFESDGSMIETLITRVAEKLSEAEQTTSEAIRGLANSFAGLDARLKTAEERIEAAAEGEPVERRFENLAVELAEKVEQARTEMTERISGAADAKFERMETALRDLGGAVDLAERRSAQAIDRMGREVMRIAHTLGERVGQVEANSAKAVEQVSGEMGRIADAMETRMRQADTAQAAALEKLGGEIGRIAERLAERIAAAERRTSQTADAMSEQAARLAEKVSQRQDQSASDLVERIRQSEERAVKMLQEAQAKLDQRLVETQRQLALEAVRHEEAERQAIPAAHAALDPFPQPAHESDPFVDEAHSEPAFREEPAAMPEPAFMAQLPHAAQGFSDEIAFKDEIFAEEPQVAEKPAEDEDITSAEFKLFEEDEEFRAAPTEAFPAMSGFDPARADALAGKTTDEHPPAFAPDEHIFAPEPRSPRDATRQMLDEARAAARQNAPDNKNRRGRPIAADAGTGPVEALPYSPPGLSGFFKLKRKKHSSTLRTAILASGTAATLSMAAVGYGLLAAGHWGESSPAKAEKEAAPGPVAATPPASTDLAAAALDATLATDAPAEPASAPELHAGSGPKPGEKSSPNRRLAAAPTQLAVQNAKPPRAAPAAVPPAPARPTAPSAPAPAAVANPNPPLVPQPASSAGTARALYSTAVRQIETGDNSGLDALRKAANLSYAPAQFYLGKLYETGGAGLAKDAVEARRWTERAAQGGDPKAMHNLALYYFEGDGGPKNSTMAASWFRRAAELGLQDSQYNLARLHEQGFGVAQNPAEAYKWYLIAASGGDADARAGAERTKKQLSPDAQAAAERSAGALRAQITGTLRTAQGGAAAQ